VVVDEFVDEFVDVVVVALVVVGRRRSSACALTSPSDSSTPVAETDLRRTTC
jgi:hypothetical protein